MSTNKNMTGPGLIVALGDRPEGKESGGNMEAMSSAANVDTVPLDVLAMPDDDEQMQNPEVGDQVDNSVTGKVVAIEGGMAKIERVAINGQKLPDGDGDEEAGDQDQQTEDAERQGLGEQAAGMGPMMIVLLLLWFASMIPAHAQNASIEGSFPGGNPYNGAAFTNSYILTKVPDRLYKVTGYNGTNVPICVQFFMTNGIPANGATPLFVIPTPANSTYTLDFAYSGCLIDSGVVCASTTTNTLTLAPTPCISIVAVESLR